MTHVRGSMPPTPTFELRFSRVDPEAMIGLPPGRMSNPTMMTGLLCALVSMAAIYSTAWFCRGTEEGGTGQLVWKYLTAFDHMPIAIVLLSTWALSILALKLLKIRAQRKALSVVFTPRDPMWTLNGRTAEAVIAEIGARVEEPERFMYLHRVLGVLRTMRNIGRIGDVDELFESRAGADEAIVDSGYSAVKAFIWGAPVLGFIGTVLGLITATANFGVVLQNGEKMKQDSTEMVRGLTSVLGGLDTAFVTTAEGLIAAFILYMAQMLVKQADERLLDDVREACSARIVTRVRIEPIKGE